MTTSRLLDASPDVPSTLAALDAARALLRSRSADEVVKIVVTAVGDLGGSVARPDRSSASQLPIDVTFGIGETLVPTGDAATLERLAEALPLLIEDAHVALERIHRESDFASSATTDPLTGLANRRVVVRALGRLRPGDTVAVIDIDRFKAVNDTLGHMVGDDVLRAFAEKLRLVSRAADTVARVGGDEFLLLLPRTDAEGSAVLLDRLRRTWSDDRPRPVTFSAGVAPVDRAGGGDALERADEALYDAKRSGRDATRVVG